MSDRREGAPPGRDGTRTRRPCRLLTWVAAVGLSIGIAGRAQALAWPDVVERVGHDLTVTDPATRRAAARAIGSLGPEAGGPLVLVALEDTDDDVRLAAAEAAVGLRVARATSVVIGWLNAPDARLRRAACDVARAMPDPKAIAPLARTLGDAEADVRAAAAEALGHQASADAVAPLLGRLDDSTPSVRMAIVEALVRLSDPRAVLPLVGKVEDSSVDVRRAVVRALGELGDARAAPAIVLTLRDPNQDVRREGIVALGRMRAADAVDTVAPFLFDRAAAVRAAAAFALGRIATPDAVRVLVGALGVGDDAVAAAGPSPVRDALVAAGERSISPLHAMLESAPPGAATSAAWVLGAIRAHREAHAIVVAMRRGSLSVAAALHALAGAGSPADVPVALEFLTDDSPAIRAQAIDTAVALLDRAQPDGRAVEPLAAALRDSRLSTDERVGVVQALGRTGAPRAAILLGELVGSRERRLRIAAVDALGGLGSGDADGALLRAIGSSDDEMRLHAAASLAETGGARARDALVSRFAMGDEVDRASILTALGGILARVPSEPAVRQLAAALDLAAGAERDALIDAVGRAPVASAARALAVAARSDEPLDRAEAAVAGAARIDEPTLTLVRTLASDSDARVRAQAAWALGRIGAGADVERLARLTHAENVEGAANAVAAIGRILARAGAGAPDGPTGSTALCSAASDPRPFVRANAFAAIALSGARCLPEGRAREVLLEDPSDDVRAAAALVVATEAGPEDLRALDRCARADVSGAVASRCLSGSPTTTKSHAVLVYIVPENADAPRPGAPYVMLMPDGLLRAGTSDRRGAAFDPAAPEGPLKLVSVAPVTH